MSRERRSQIHTLVQERDYISVKELSEILFVSEPTIRRDLTILEQEGVLQRRHGGAVSIHPDQIQTPYVFRTSENTKEKKKIASLAKKLIRSGDHIFIDSSSTSYYLAQAIDADLMLHVLTHSFFIANTLAQSNNKEVEVACGRYNARYGGVYSIDACNYIKNHYADYCFFSCNGVDVNQGITNLHKMDAEIIRTYHQHSKKTVCLVDHTKLNQKFYEKIFDLSEIDILVTDCALPDELDNYCNFNDIEVIYE